MDFKLKSDFKPRGSQPEAIDRLMDGIKKGLKYQTLLGVTGSGKTFTIANVIEKVKKSTLVIAHNKTLAAQLYSEFKEFFPDNKVEFFVSYYDYYQPESYIPQRDQYIEKDAQINPKIEQMRLEATASLMMQKDVIVIASVSAIYSVGRPDYFEGMGFELKKGAKINRDDILEKLVNIQYQRNEFELVPGRFRVKGDTIDLFPGYYHNMVRIEMFGDEIERLVEVDKITGKEINEKDNYYVFPARHFVIPEDVISNSIKNIRKDLDKRLPQLEMVEAHRLKQRTLYDIDMIEETGFCKGIENYSVYFDGRKPGERPYSLLDYFKDFLIVIDESHQTIPQLHGMYNGDYSRKKNLIDFGFRLPSAFDNRPLKFEEFEIYMRNNKVIFVSATPGPYERIESGRIVEQIIRPTGLIDPEVEVRPSKGQVEDIVIEIERVIFRGDRVLLTTLTKRLAEELTEFLAEKKIRTRYMHSEIETLERTEIIRELRLGSFDVLVGINLLREGLDIPEVGFIGILDADKEGFLRDTKSLIQIIGRAARNVNSKVVLYGDKLTDSMKGAIAETNRRRQLQQAYNEREGITPQTIIKPVKEKLVIVKDTKHIPKKDVPSMIKNIEKEMYKMADQLDFEAAIMLREQVKRLKERLR
ncbi:MAG: excinuclease ABC subunit UvrB [Candidatus Aminicenantes bacterium]|nr:excinuclease ABC subunit UvrB [Candidatus Aminicenantes bacterium]